MPSPYTLRVALSGVVVLALIAALVVTLYLPSSSRHATSNQTPPGIRPVPPAPTLDVSTRQGSLIDAISGGAPLRRSPGGPIVGRLAAGTQFGSPRVVPVVQAVPGWLGVIVTELPNNQIGWIPARGARLARVSYSILVRTRTHNLTVFFNGRPQQTIPAAVGTNGLPTPVGRFAVTDRLEFRPRSDAYGCCALGLSAHQLKLEPGWTGQNLVAIHSTLETSSVGRPVSHGCVRVTLADGRRLVSTIPLGTLVTVRDA